MRVYTKIVMSMDTSEILHEEFYEYEGPVDKCDFGTDVNVPPPTAQETEMLQLQIDLLKEQAEKTEWMEPWILKSLRLRKTEEGYEQVPFEEWYQSLTPAERLNVDIEQESGEMLMRALKGEMEVDPSFEFNYKRQRSVVEEELSRNNIEEGSEPWIRRMAEFDARMEGIRNDIRWGRMSTAQGIQTAQAGELSRKQNLFFEKSMAQPGAYGQAASGISAPLSTLASWRNMQLQGNIAESQASSTLWGGLGSLLGTGAGMYAGIKWG